MFGIEAFVVLKDMWAMEQEDVEDTINWVAQALIGAATSDRRDRDDAGAPMTTPNE